MSSYHLRLGIELRNVTANLTVINRTLQGTPVTVIGATTFSTPIGATTTSVGATTMPAAAAVNAPAGPSAMAADISSLDSLTHLNGVPIATIEARAKPGGWSTGGFIGRDETFLGVLQRDWKTISLLGLTHTEMADHLRTIRAGARAFYGEQSGVTSYDYTQFPGMKALVEGMHGASFVHRPQTIRVTVETYGGHQEDIFKTGGRMQLNQGVVVDSEWNWCRDFVYQNTTTGQKITVPYGLFEYIRRYGFYEGTTAYRVDPLQLISVITGERREDIQMFLQMREVEALIPKFGTQENGNCFTRIAAKIHAPSMETIQTAGKYVLGAALGIGGYFLLRQMRNYTGIF